MQQLLTGQVADAVHRAGITTEGIEVIDSITTKIRLAETTPIGQILNVEVDGWEMQETALEPDGTVYLTFYPKGAFAEE